VSDRGCAGVSAAMLMLLELIKALVFAVEPILSGHPTSTLITAAFR
jgi:hypothetical protein